MRYGYIGLGHLGGHLAASLQRTHNPQFLFGRDASEDFGAVRDLGQLRVGKSLQFPTSDDG